MKNNLSPAVIVMVIVGVLVIVAGIGFYVWRAPSVTPAPGVSKAPPGPREGGGPDAEALRKRDEYNRTHPGAAGSR